MKIVSIGSFAHDALTKNNAVFVQYGDAFDDKSSKDAQNLLTRVKLCLADESQYRELISPISGKFISMAVKFDDDTYEARQEVEILFVSAVKCGFVIAQAETEFAWVSDATSISTKTETILSVVSEALVREAARKNKHQVEGQLRVIGVYCGYLYGRFGLDSVMNLLDNLHGLVLSVGPR